MQFQYLEWGWALFLLPLMALMFWGVIRWKENTLRKIGDPALVRTLLRGNAPRRFRISHWLLTLVIALLILSLGNLRRPSGKQQVNRTGVDVMVALDVSKSMLATDLQPNRLERAKQLVNKLMDELGNDRVGLVLFAGRAYMQMPLTADLAAARLYINSANPSMVASQGTVISEALRLSNAAFNAHENKYKAIILITDGEDHDPEAPAMVKTLKEKGVMVCAVGVGSAEGATIFDEETGSTKRDNEGNVVVTRLNDVLLRQIASGTDGEYVQLVSTDMAVKGIKNRINSMEQRTIQDTSLAGFETFYFYFLWVALALLVLEFIVNIVPARLLKNKIFLAKKKVS